MAMLVTWLVGCAGSGGKQSGARPGAAAEAGSVPSAGGPSAGGPSAGGPSAERLAFWKQVREQKDAPPPGADLAALADELAGYLRSPDPDVRDRLAYEVLAGWIERGVVPPATVRHLTELMIDRLDEGIGTAGDDRVFGRSFATLILAEVASRDVAAPSMSDAELTAMVTAARTYASKEMDLRGYVEGRGWAHAAAHTADWLRELSRNPKLGRERGKLVLDAVLDLTVRRHGHTLHHGEDGRLALPVMQLLRLQHITPSMYAEWLASLLAPLRERGDYDEARAAAQRNGRNLAFTLFVHLSLEDARNPLQEAALVTLTAVLRQ
jgi:hypothetical protein